MKKETKKSFVMAVSTLAAFGFWTVLVCFVDVKAIGPQGTTVGLATVNGFFHQLTGVHLFLYLLTDWLSLVPLGIVMGFGILGLIQWVKRKHIRRVDDSLLVLGGFYFVTMAVYVLFETFVVNYRPVQIDGVLEASYPSSTTMLVMCVMSTAILQVKSRIKNSLLRGWVLFIMIAFTVFMVVARLVSGVHWLTDVVGGALLSGGLVLMYRSVSSLPFRK